MAGAGPEHTLRGGGSERQRARHHVPEPRSSRASALPMRSRMASALREYEHDGMGRRGEASDTPVAAGRGIRVLSCNLLSGQVPADALGALLVRYGVDLVCPQELGEGCARAIAAQLPEGELAPNAEHRGLGIAARAPVSVRRIPLAGRPAWVARLEVEDWPSLRQPIEIVNVHLLAPHTWPYFPRKLRRADQVADLLEYLDRAEGGPRALFGDFNATPSWPAYRKIASRYRDGVRERLRRPPPTWPRFASLPIHGLLRIDHCFVSALRVERVLHLPLPGSDHYGLCIDLVESEAPSLGAIAPYVSPAGAPPRRRREVADRRSKAKA